MFKNSESDFWNSDSFEDAITRAFVALYESEIDPQDKGNAPRQIDDGYLLKIRRSGVFIPAPDRLVNSEEIDGIDGVPFSGCISLGAEVRRDNDDDRVESYCRVNAFRKIDRFPAEIRRPCNGPAYEFVCLFPQDKGPMMANRFHFVLKNGRPQIATIRGFEKIDPQQNKNAEVAFLASMQFVADARHTWRITAEDGRTKVSVGAYSECVKSLLFARQLPMTAAGRKRPILHVVQAHKRRIREGIDVDIEQYLRGVDDIVMDGTRFRVSPPATLAASRK